MAVFCRQIWALPRLLIPGDKAPLAEKEGVLTDCIINAPVSGWVGPLAEAPDPVFAERMMGDGVLLDPTSGDLTAPCAGEVVAIARTKHAVTVRSNNGAQILMHVGIETVALEGEGFTAHVTEGQKVEPGDSLISFDLEILAGRAKSLQIPIVIANSDEYRIRRRADAGVVAAGDFIMDVVAVAGGRDVAWEENTGSETFSESVVIPLPHGIHARPAARLSEAAKKFKSRIMVSTLQRGVSARSPVALMGLATRLGDEVTISATGSDAREAVEDIVAQIAGGLGEQVGAIKPDKRQDAACFQPIEKLDPVALDGSEVLKGVTGAPGLCIGSAVQLNSQEIDVVEYGLSPEEERRALLEARNAVRKAITETVNDADSHQQEIMSAHLALLDDPTLVETAAAHIESGKSAGFAWRAASREQAELLIDTGDARMAERADDLLDIESQVLLSLSGGEDTNQKMSAGTIVLADELLPSQLIRLAAAGIAGVATVGGGPTSHVSILAAGKGIPLLTAADARIRTIPDDTKIILEADRGVLLVAPSQEDTNAIQQTIERRRQNRTAALANAEEDCFTKDGSRIEVFANLGASAEAAEAVKNGAEGCGLLRSEFLFLDRAAPPSEDEQLEAYQTTVDGLQGRPLVIRTLDIGGDKPAAFINIPAEENPALGLRGVRVSLRYPELLRAQFRAILRVKSSAPVHIMLPMVIARDEFTEARRICDEASSELGLDGPASLGVMIETPASAVLADSLVQDVDFFSIGTNDLTQYTLAIDRGNTMLAGQADGLHPAVLRMVKATAEAGHAAGKWVGVCGALASDLAAAPLLVGLGVTELSSTAARLAELKAFIRTIEIADCREAALEAVNLHSPTEVRAFAESRWPHLKDWT